MKVYGGYLWYMKVYEVYANVLNKSTLPSLSLPSLSPPLSLPLYLPRPLLALPLSPPSLSFQAGPGKTHEPGQASTAP